MKRREDEMTCHRSLHRDSRRLEITDLTDHDNIGILAEEGFESCGIEIVFFLIDFTLDHSFELVLYRIFEGDDFAIRGIEGREE
jgi:hypothetical protein